MKKFNCFKRLISLCLCMALMMCYIPLNAKADDVKLHTSVSESVADPGTADSWETMMGIKENGNRYAGRVWVDKSVYRDGDVAVLNNSGEPGSTFQVELKEDEEFQIIFSALGSTMTTQKSITEMGPVDVVLILDTSVYMEEKDHDGVTRLERCITAVNGLLNDVLAIDNVRIGVVTYNIDSETVLPLAAYRNGVKLAVTDHGNHGASNRGVVSAYDHDGKELGNDNGYAEGTNLQSGIDRGFGLLAEATEVEGRVPVAIVLNDGPADRASQEGYYEIEKHDDPDGTIVSGRNLYLSTLLNAAYAKTKIEENYGKEAIVYTVGVGIADNANAELLLHPADALNGFHYMNTNSEVKKAYEYFQRWSKGETVTYADWTFDHNYPNQGAAINDSKITGNIHYSDAFYDVSDTELVKAFEHICREMSSGAFNPISSSTSAEGGTGVDDTPLVYVDFIGQYMQVKEIQAVTLFGHSYGVINNPDGTYTVTEATGTNPTTNERWNTAEDIKISVTQIDGVQKMEVRINQEILPILMERVLSETVGSETVSTITELVQPPLRVYYTVGISSELLLPGGKVDASKLQGYPYIDDEAGTVSFYSNQFGVMNKGGGGDSHVGFQPAPENRFYYHQSNHGIFTKISNKSDSSTVTIPESNTYGILWDESKYDLTWMSYDDYQNAKDSDKVYTYVSYYRPTPTADDAENAAEEVTYLVCTDWKYMKESVAFYDANAESYLEGGQAIVQDQVADTVSAYKKANPDAQIYAVLGVRSLRTSRLHNMMVDKTANLTNTAAVRYAPEYTYETASIHNGNDVVVWLGNNGRLTVNIETGIALTNTVTETIGNADEICSLRVTVPEGVDAQPVVVDMEGASVASDYQDHVLTVHAKANQTVYVTGIPGGTICQIGGNVGEDYDIADITPEVRIPSVREVLSGADQFVPAVVISAPNKYGNLFITKEITGDHAIPEGILNTPFEMIVDVGTELAGEMLTVAHSERPSTLYSVTVDDNGHVRFRIKARQTFEILRLPAGTQVTVTEVVTDDRFAVSYRTRNHSGESADWDNILTIPSEGSATAVVMNRYTPSPVSVDLDIVGTKIFHSEGEHAGGSFVYQVQKWTGSVWEDIPGKNAQTHYAADESGTKHFIIEDVLSGMAFTEVGNYAYQVIEVVGDVANVTYDRTLYTFDVTVTDENGQLAATVRDLNDIPILDGSYEVTFTNTYHTAPVTVDIAKVVENKSGDLTVSKAGFGFKAVQTDAAWTPLKGDAASELLVYSDAAGEARLTATYKNAGTYYYILTEIDRNMPGWIWSNAEYHITVTVTEENGELTAALDIEKINSKNGAEKAKVNPEDATQGMVSFVNIYDPEDASLDLDGSVSVALSGMTSKPHQFTFHVYKDGDRKTPLLTGTNGLDTDVGFVVFDQELSFDEEAVYQYDILQIIPEGAVYDVFTGRYVLNGVSYDPTVYDMVVEVCNDAATGKLVASCYFEDSVTDTVVFHNSYKAVSDTYTLGGNTVLHGRAPKADEFTFELYEDGVLQQCVTNLSNGSFRFRPITYTQAGIYTYQIKQAAGDLPGVRYDGSDHPITVKVTVTDTDGVLNASANISNGDIRFENTYIADPARVTFNGIKKLVGNALQDETFVFNLYSTDHSFDITKSSAQLLATATNFNGIFTFVSELGETGTYYFVILEDDTAAPVADVVYDRTQYRFMVKVTDVGDGQLRAKLTDMITGVSDGAAASVSADIAFTNAICDEVMSKRVYRAGATDAEIDGEKVNKGDILTYFITYTNYHGEDVVINVLDPIPDHTSYIEGSASHNGGYTGDYVTWILSVARGRTVTLSFDVKVESTNAVVANTAVIRDGRNTYYTNEVTNHTIANVLYQDVFSAADTAASIDGRKVYEGDELLYQVSFTNPTNQTADICITDLIPEHTTYVDGSADHGGIYQDGVVTWKLNDIPAWGIVTVSFKVTVNTGVDAARICNQATATDGTNSYQTNWVDNYTVCDEVAQQVFNSKVPNVNVDGRNVNAADILTYAISYKNTSDEKVNVTITDRIPDYADYIAGSADHGGTFRNGVITWTVEAKAGETVLVTFKVKVGQVAGVTVKNSAVIQEGKNTYTTNEVSNFVQKSDVSSNPQTADLMELQLLCLLLALSGGMLIAVLYCVKRKEL